MENHKQVFGAFVMELPMKKSRVPQWYGVHAMHVHSFPVLLIYAHDKIGVPFDAYNLHAAIMYGRLSTIFLRCLLTVRHSRTTLILNRDCPVDLLQFNRVYCVQLSLPG